ncbi:STAS domain-containing protein [Aristaeella lactis]|uniref:Anti-sigma B factor antagonist n=1 Tax=Aristaeella lactis TaxID=3046383 RepID=A0AC61PHM9_9FIRM|nr:STAS domain-containing protein [Aristaeella lactis]QUA53507.1 STAS domain-containing protein [Aristaeella lactis]SMC36277.1 anti-sigma B factor antagonist [Aristaeella lactis]
MTIRKEQNGGALDIAPEGRLDTTTAPELEAELKNLEGVTELTFDLAGLEYISSAGLRVLLSAQKMMNKQGSMIILNTRPEIMDIFEITGFTDILNIQ